MNKNICDKNNNINKKIGIYIHIPFCKSKCIYCDFLSFSLNNEYMIKQYINSLKKEINNTILKLDKIKSIDNSFSFNYSNITIDTIYIGGGTPSFIEAKYIKEILDTIKSEFNICFNAEITIEVNPESITSEKLEMYKLNGINRISIGLQTTNDKILKSLGRLYTYSEFKEKYNLIKKYFNNINIDLMFGLPFQDINDLKKDIKEIVDLNPNHISTYSLILEENTKLYKEVENFNIKLPEDTINRDMYWYIKTNLEKNGYIHYEISNFSKEKYESKHNIHCWEQKEYLGYGIGAASYFNNTRFSNLSNLPLYIDNMNNNIFDINIEEIQDNESKQKEYMLLNLRMLKGVNINKFKNLFNKDPLIVFKEELDKLVNKGLLEIINKNIDNNKLNNKNKNKNKTKIKDNKKEKDLYIKLTNKGLDLANIVWEEFI